MGRVSVNGPGDQGSVPGPVLAMKRHSTLPRSPELERHHQTQKMVLDAALLNTQDYKVQMKGKVEQAR